MAVLLVFEQRRFAIYLHLFDGLKQKQAANLTGKTSNYFWKTWNTITPKRLRVHVKQGFLTFYYSFTSCGIKKVKFILSAFR